MGTVDDAIAAPRKATPRTRVPAGSVGIAGRQTGVYPRQSPGGWQLIGRTSLALFDASRDPASIFAPGDRVKFVRARSDGGAGFPAQRRLAERSREPARHLRLRRIHVARALGRRASRRPAHDDPGHGPLGTPGPRRAGGRPDGRDRASPGKRACRQRRRCRGARGDADWSGAALRSAHGGRSHGWGLQCVGRQSAASAQHAACVPRWRRAAIWRTPRWHARIHRLRRRHRRASRARQPRDARRQRPGRHRRTRARRW